MNSKNKKRQKQEEEKANKDKQLRKLEGIVVSDRMDKTVVVELEQIKKHPLYKKRYAKHIKIKAHDRKNDCQIGDTVQLVETSPKSKSKSFQVTKKVKTEK